MFSSKLLAQACVLWSCGATSEDQIAVLCNIGIPAERLRVERMAVLYRKNKFLVYPLEWRAYKQFSEYIATHKL